MKRFFQNIALWVYIKIHSILINISIALYNTEIDILKADPNNLDEKDKKETRMFHRNEVLEKFYIGQTDEKYVKDYYELLKKADKFRREATPHKMELALDKHMRHLNTPELRNKPEADDRVFNYTGFFDENHKHIGKTLAEVLALEMLERRSTDDEYELLYIFNNKPIEVGLSKIFDVVEKTGNKINVPAVDTNYKETDEIAWTYDELQMVDMQKKSKAFEFPIKAFRDEDVVNKIEQLTESLHVKKIGFEHRILEFFIPLKFKTEEIEENSEIFKEITNIKSIFVRNDYGELQSFGITKFRKRIKYKETHEIWKFDGIEMENVGLR